MMPTFAEVEKQLLSYKDSFLDFPFGKEVAVYKIKLPDKSSKMFALLAEHRGIVSLSLKCNPDLAIRLREKYDSVMPGYHLSKKHWNTIVLSGQLSWQETIDLIDHSYRLVLGI